jgi:hypothetical protein
MPLSPSVDPNDFPVFGKMNKAAYVIRVRNLLAPIYKFAKEMSFDWKNIVIDQGCISKIADMVQRRAVYLHIYHDIEMGELTEACLNCFWIIKFHPFRDRQVPNQDLSIIFALALFTRAISYEFEKQGGRKPNFTAKTIENLKHAFTYRDISKEALMAIASCLTV